jgi:hypothetical protein
VDIAGLASFMGNCAFVLGAFFLAGAVAASLWVPNIFPAVILIFVGGVLFMIRGAQRFDRNKKSGADRAALIKTMVLPLLVLCGVGAIMVYGQVSTRVEVKPEGIVIGGMYGTTIPAEEIREVSLEDEIPRILVRNNGLGYGEIKKGHFTLEGLGRGRLYLESREGPHICIYTADSYAIINYRDPDRTRAFMKAWRKPIHRCRGGPCGRPQAGVESALTPVWSCPCFGRAWKPAPTAFSVFGCRQ